MWTGREKELNSLAEIEDYLDSIDNFHDYRLGNIEYNSEESTAVICVESDHKPSNSLTDGLVWDFRFEEIKSLSYSVDTMQGNWICEITVENQSEILFALDNGYISVSASKLKLGVPSKI